jgi:hypothetical protein
MHKPKLHDIVFPLNFKVPQKIKEVKGTYSNNFKCDEQIKITRVIFRKKKWKSLQAKLDASSSQTHQGIIKPFFQRE